MARSIETRAKRVVPPELQLSLQEVEPENVEDIFSAVWNVPEPVVPETPIPPAEILEKQLVQVETARESYSEFKMAAASVGSSLMSLFTSCGAACLAHGHGIVGSGLSFDLSALGHLGHSHDHEHEEESQKKTPPLKVLTPSPKKKAVPPAKSSTASRYIRASDLGLFFLSSAVAV